MNHELKALMTLQATDVIVKSEATNQSLNKKSKVKIQKSKVQVKSQK